VPFHFRVRASSCKSGKILPRKSNADAGRAGSDT
jgi:hypothetical protein